MDRIELNLSTGEITVVPLTPEEEAAALAAAAVNQQANSLDSRAARSIDSMDRLLFELEFDQENRVRVLESKASLTRAQYRDALIARWKSLNA